MQKHFIYIDDFKVALRYMNEQFKVSFPNDLLETFGNGMLAYEHIKKLPALPFMIFTDLNMEPMSGANFLDLIKRDPALHLIPVVMVSAELDPQTRRDLEKVGVFQFIAKPFQTEEVKTVIERYTAQAIDQESLRILEISFVDDSIDLMSKAEMVMRIHNEAEVKDLFRVYHTIKGGAFTLQYPSIGIFIHLLENILMVVGKYKTYSNEMISLLLKKANLHILVQLNAVKNGKVLEAEPTKLVEGLKLIISNAKAGWLAAKSVETPSILPTAIINEGEAKSAFSLRVNNQKLDELQNRFKKIQQIRVKMNLFAQELSQEFSDESFPKELIRLVSDMEKESMGIMEFFISLRVVSASRVKVFAIQTAQQAADALKKKIITEVTIEEGLEIDQAVIEVLEASLTHLLRNSIDHGIENSDQRHAAGKAEAGKLNIELTKESRDRFVMKISDDGAGIDIEKLRNAVAKKGLIEENSLRSLADDKILDLIFLDGLSTKEELTEMSGRGMGLSAVKDRILQMGGTIEVNSQQGKGTDFEIRMPRVFQL